MSNVTVDLGASSGRVSLWDGERLTETHRFENIPLRENGRLMWDYRRIFENILAGIRKAAEEHAFESIGIDTWGVDFAVVSDGGVVYPPAHYRDELNAVTGSVDERELYERTGVASSPINTLYQLLALKKIRPNVFDGGNRILLMPDFIKWLLTGEIGADITAAATTQLLSPFAADWDFDLIERLGFPAKMFPSIVSTGAAIKPEILGGLPNVRVFSAGHDTACAAAVAGDGLFISCGTWSIVGVRTEKPIISEKAKALGAAVELDHGGKPLLLRNITGLWIIQQLRRELGGIPFSEMEETARNADLVYALDPDDAVFSAEGAMRPRIAEYCRRSGQPAPKTDGEYILGVYAGLAAKYAEVVSSIEDLTGKAFGEILIIGGGAKSELLCELTQKATGKRVVKGPTEATAIGNAIVQQKYLQERD